MENEQRIEQLKVTADELKNASGVIEDATHRGDAIARVAEALRFIRAMHDGVTSELSRIESQAVKPE